MKRLLTIAITLLMVIGLVACSGNKPAETDTEPKDDQPTVGFIFMSLTDTSLIRIRQDAEAAAKEKGVNFVVVDSEGDSSKQIEAIENMITTGVDVIIIQAVDSAAVTPYLQEAMDAGIKVLAFGIQTEVYDVWYCNDPFEIGKAVAQMAIDFTNENLDGKAQVGILGFPLMQNFIDRVASAKDYLAANAPGMEIVAEETALVTEDAMNAVENMLQAHPDINIIIGFSDGAALGANEAFKAAGKEIGKAACFGADISSTGAETILANEFYVGSIDVSSLVLGETAIDISLKMLNGEPIEGITANGEVFMNITEVTAENAADYIQK